MKKPVKILNSKMRKIIQILHSYGGMMTAHEITSRGGPAYNTVRKYIPRLEEMEIILCANKDIGINKIYKINYKDIYGKENGR